MLVVTPLLVRRQRGRLVCNNLVLRQDSTDHKARPLGQAVYVSKRVVRVCGGAQRPRLLSQVDRPYQRNSLDTEATKHTIRHMGQPVLLTICLHLCLRGLLVGLDHEAVFCASRDTFCPKSHTQDSPIRAKTHRKCQAASEQNSKIQPKRWLKS
jgi:hypothetical protein